MVFGGVEGLSCSSSYIVQNPTTKPSGEEGLLAIRMIDTSYCMWRKKGLLESRLNPVSAVRANLSAFGHFSQTSHKHISRDMVGCPFSPNVIILSVTT